MATTIELKKEIVTKKYRDSGFNFFGYFDHKYEVLIKKKLSDDLKTMWFNAYVKLEEPLKYKYLFESYRIRNIVGCDSSDYSSSNETFQENIVIDRIVKIINEHHETQT